MDFPVVRGPFGSFEEFLDRLDNVPRRHQTLLIGVDGCGGSGKSTLARRLTEAHPGVTVVHMDDFYLPSGERHGGPHQARPVGSDFDWFRLEREVLQPLADNREGRYRHYDWTADRLIEPAVTVPVGGIVVVEGVYATRHELAPYYDFVIWVECPREVRLGRGLARDGEAARDRWERDWMVAEDLYAAVHEPAPRADLVLDGSGM